MTRCAAGPLRRERIGRILVRAPNWIGDAAMAIPVIRGLHRSFPAARMTVLSRPGVPSIFAGLPGVDQLMTDDPAGLHRGLRGRLRLAAEIRRERFDLAVLLPNAFSPALVTALAGVPRRLGYRADGRSALLTHRVSPPPARSPVHQIDAYRGILTGAGLTADGRDPAIALSPAELQAARATLTGFGVDPAQALVGVNPGAAFGGAKRWPADRFAAVCRLWPMRPGRGRSSSAARPRKPWAMPWPTGAETGPSISVERPAFATPSPLFTSATSFSPTIRAPCTWPRRSMFPWWRSSAPPTTGPPHRPGRSADWSGPRASPAPRA